jgi:protein gp37
VSTTTSIEWTDRTWNPLTGCTKVSPGCDNCYAKTMHERFHGAGSFDTVELHRERLEQPLHWRKPRCVFVNSMSDLFHQGVPDQYIAQIFAVMWRAEPHTFQILTKRAARMRALLRSERFHDRVVGEASTYTGGADPGLPWPLPNVWLGVSVEDQKWERIRGDALRETPAAVRFYSAEPLLGAITANLDSIDWLIVGGESGPGARPMHPDWARALRDQCVAAGVPFLFKQWGAHLPIPVLDDPDYAGGRAFDHPRGGRTAPVIKERAPGKTHFRGAITRPMEPGDKNGFGVMLDRDTIAVRVGKKRAGRELDGRTWDQYPAGTS